MPPVLQLSVATVAVRAFGIGRGVLRYLERLVSHDVALRGMTELRTTLYDRLAVARPETLLRVRRGDLLARVGADVDTVGDVVVRGLLPAGVAAALGAGTVLAMCAFWPPAGLALGGCLVLAGVVAPAIAARAARTTEQRALQSRADMTATALGLLDDAGPLLVGGRADAELRGAARVRPPPRSRHRRRGRSRPRSLPGSVSSPSAWRCWRPCSRASRPSVPGCSPPSSSPWSCSPRSRRSRRRPSCPPPRSRCSARAPRRPGCWRCSTPDRPAAPPTTPPAGPRSSRRTSRAAGRARPRFSRARARPAARPFRRHRGPSGTGKTTTLLTLAGLLPRQAGTLTLDGHDVDHLDRHAVAAAVVVGTEDAHVFGTTVLENLRVARGDLTAPEATAVLARVGLADWLDGLPDGLDTVVGPDARTVSGGERRRLLVARALVSAAPAPARGRAGRAPRPGARRRPGHGPAERPARGGRRHPSAQPAGGGRRGPPARRRTRPRAGTHPSSWGPSRTTVTRGSESARPTDRRPDRGRTDASRSPPITHDDLVGAVVAVTSELELSAVLERFVEVAAGLTGAPYGALTVVDERGVSTAFVSTGVPGTVAESCARRRSRSGRSGRSP